MKTLLLAIAAAAALLAVTPPAAAHDASDASAASALSLSLPVAVAVAAPAALLSGAATLTVVSVQASAQGSIWVLERASDGARASVEFAGDASQAVGTAVTVSAIGAGFVLSAAGRVVCFIPNEIGRALLHDERITR